ncbi:MAG: tetratricopeptide repeat protein, partial [Pyrinomonadaceae bacterium]|nr:tetratricopeptide repeat protein [Pyrinomonadaceae bacterium]
PPDREVSKLVACDQFAAVGCDEEGYSFFVQGEWDRIDGAGDVKDVSALVPKGASAEERKQAESIISLAASARAFYSGLLGPAPATPIRIIAVRRGSGFNEAGTVLIEAGALRRLKIDSTNALLLSEAVARMWIGAQTAVRGEGSGVIRDGLVRFLATLFIEKQFGREAAGAELLRQRLAFTAVAKRDAPLSRSTPLDDTYFSSVPNRGALVWRLIDRRVGREIFINTVREQLQAGKDNLNGISLAGLRAALAQKGGEKLKTLLDQQIDQVTDMDLMIGLPQQRGAEWVSALRNLGSTDAVVAVAATSDRGEQLSVEATIPARNFADAIFKTTSKLVRAEIDPEKLYPQLDYANDSAPRSREVGEAIAEATRFFGAQDYTKAESVAREILAVQPRLQEARIILARALLAQNRIDEAEKLFRAALDEVLPTPGAIAWANIGLGEISLKKGQAAEAAKRFNDAVRADADYASSLMARAARIRVESVAGAPPVDESVRTFVKQLDQAITSGKKVDLESRVVPGELVRFIGGIVGSQPEIWQTTVLRTEPLDSNLMAVDVSVNAKELGREQSGTAVLILARAGGGWKLTGIELFEVR